MTKLEELARAIAVKRTLPGDEALAAVLWPQHVGDVLAVLEALKEPSEGMLDEAFGRGLCPQGVADLWQDMIQHIIDEHKGG
ncbi:MAG: hypothetical protein K5872_22190 [Rhizobiaceae bacterium]|nr:hypothetical protein [Rhizobiaceae bacterium]MCV0408931.1 hypothetical protein [Rhizobiaceae bacterium]